VLEVDAGFAHGGILRRAVRIGHETTGRSRAASPATRFTPPSARSARKLIAWLSGWMADSATGVDRRTIFR
jgi:hypothetical protein